jgi:prophage regulatory protein
MTAEAAMEAADSRQKCQRAVRHRELRKIVPLADTTIYEMERRGEFPQRFYLTSKCAVWDLLDEVETWLTARRAASMTGHVRRGPDPDVRSRRRRPVGTECGHINKPGISARTSRS